MPFDMTQYNIEYIREHYRQYMVKVNKGTETDIIEWLATKKNVQQYIKDLIRADMDKQART